MNKTNKRVATQEYSKFTVGDEVKTIIGVTSEEGIYISSGTHGKVINIDGDAAQVRFNVDGNDVYSNIKESNLTK